MNYQPLTCPIVIHSMENSKLNDKTSNSDQNKEIFLKTIENSPENCKHGSIDLIKDINLNKFPVIETEI